MKPWWQEFFQSGRYSMLGRFDASFTAMQVEFAWQQLGLQPGSLVLDAACGVGRHTELFARRGARVVGFDYSHSYLTEAAARLAAAGDAGGSHWSLARADLRRLPFESDSFDGATLLFNSLGYFESEDEDIVILSELARVLRPGAAVLLDVLNRDPVARSFTSQCREHVGGRWFSGRQQFDLAAGVIRSQFDLTELGGEAIDTTTRVFTPGDIQRMCAKAALVPEFTWGSWSGGPPVLDHETLIILARVPG